MYIVCVYFVLSDFKSFHVGLGFDSPLIYDESIRRSKQVFDEANNMGFNMRILNIGGSFPGGVRKRKQFLQVSCTGIFMKKEPKMRTSGHRCLKRHNRICLNHVIL